MSVAENTMLKVVPTMTWTDGEVNQNVFTSMISGATPPYPDADVLEDALDWAGTMYPDITGGMHPTLTGSHVTVYKYDLIGEDWDEVGQINWNNVPSGVGDPLPRGVAGLINAKSVDPDVSGKKYLPGTMEARLTNGLWISTYVINLGGFANDWTSPFSGFTTGADWVPGIWSPTNLTHYACTGTYIVPTIPAYQRRRKNNVGI